MLRATKMRRFAAVWNSAAGLRVVWTVAYVCARLSSLNGERNISNAINQHSR